MCTHSEVVMWEVLTRKMPFEGQDFMQYLLMYGGQAAFYTIELCRGVSRNVASMLARESQETAVMDRPCLILE